MLAHTTRLRGSLGARRDANGASVRPIPKLTPFIRHEVQGNAAAQRRPVAAQALQTPSNPKPAPQASRPCATSATTTTTTSASTSTPSSSSPASGGATSFEAFQRSASSGDVNLVPLVSRMFSDHLTPVQAYRCLVKDNDVEAPSFLLESVVGGNTQGRYSFLGAMPALEVVATQQRVVVLDHERGTRTVSQEADPMEVVVQLSRNWRPAEVEGLPKVFTGGWVGYAGYDTVRYVYPSKIPFESGPEDDRHLPDMHLALHNDVVVFDQATKIIYVVSWVHIGDKSEASLRSAYDSGRERHTHLVELLSTPPPPGTMPSQIAMELTQRPTSPGQSNMTEAEFKGAVLQTKEHIKAGDIFQLVLSQRFERRTFADPFEVYRALRVVNPSPYMVYMQARGCIIVSSSPEILCRLDGQRIVTNRPLAGTRRRGRSSDEDVALEKELLADEKERAEHIMLVDLGRNDVGKVSTAGSVRVEKLMEVERYSHVMHISSTVTGQLLPGLDCWDALRSALPAGTISGAPKVRAMQIIDDLEVNRRGPYGGGVGVVSFQGSMDMALALRTMVITTARDDTLYQYRRDCGAGSNRREWVVHLQAGAGIVADSQPDAEFEETVNKAAALGRAIDLAEQAFVQ